MTIDIEKIQQAQAELEKLEQLKGLVSGETSIVLPFEIDKTYFIRTATYHILLEVKEIKGKFLEGRGTWVADSGRFSDFINKGVLSSSAEVEAVTPPMGVNTDTIIDYYIWTHQFLSETR